jgi:hypothetical protein
MNSIQRKAIEQAIAGVYPADLPLAQFESILGLKGILTDLERACDPEAGKVNDDGDFGEWEGKKSLKLWRLMESYDDFQRTEVPSDPSAYLKAKFVDKKAKIKVSGSQAALVSEFFVFMNRAIEEWAKSKRKASKSGSPKLPVQKLESEEKIEQDEPDLDKLLMESCKPEATLTDAITNVFQIAAADTGKRITAMFARFTDTLVRKLEKKEEITRDFIIKTSAFVAGITVHKMEAALDKIKKSDNAEIENAKSKIERAKGPFCGYSYGKKSKMSGQVCGEYCKDKTLYPNKNGEMIHLCVKHIKTAATKHTCQFPDKKNGGCCGKRVPDEVTEPYNRDGKWKGVTYAGLWICGQHKLVADKNLDKADHPCTKKNTKGKQCERVAQKDKDGNWSTQCVTCNKREEKKVSKKANDRRAAMKKGKGKSKGKDKEKEVEEVVVSEVKVEDEKESKKTESKAEKSKKKSKDESDSESESESEDESGNDSDSESGSDSEDEKPQPAKKAPAKSGAKQAANDSDNEGSNKKKPKDEDKKEEKVDKSDDEKLMVSSCFTMKKFKDADWTLKRLTNEDNEEFNCFVDTNSGLVCYNVKDTNAEEVTNADLTALGVWNNKAQTYAEMSKAAITYANKLGVKTTKK